MLRDIVNDSKPGLCFGDTIASCYFNKNRCALFLDCKNHSGQILLRDSNQVRDSILALTELLGVMTQLEKEASILLLEDPTREGIDLYYEGKTDFAEATLPERYTLSRDSQFSCVVGEPAQIDDILFGTKLPEPLIDAFLRLFRAKVFPTAALVRFIKHGYLTDAQFNTMRALWLNRVAIIVAIILGIVPLFKHKDVNDPSVGAPTELVQTLDTLLTTR